MDPPPPRSSAPAAGGCLLALGIIAGIVYGTFVGNPSLALLIGLAVGIAAAIGAFLFDRRR